MTCAFFVHTPSFLPPLLTSCTPSFCNPNELKEESKGSVPKLRPPFLTWPGFKSSHLTLKAAIHRNPDSLLCFLLYISLPFSSYILLFFVLYSYGFSFICPAFALYASSWNKEEYCRNVCVCCPSITHIEWSRQWSSLKENCAYLQCRSTAL